MKLRLEQESLSGLTLPMERIYGKFKCNPAVVSPNGKRQFFRGHHSAKDILRMAKGDFDPFVDKYKGNIFDPAMDMESGCGASSCEVGAEDN